MKPTLIFALLTACAPTPYLRMTSAPSATTTVTEPVFTAAGLALHVASTCSVQVVEHWCPLTDPQCRPNPKVVTTEPTPCTKELEVASASVRAPWGQVYPGAVANGILDVKIDWAAAGIDPLDDANTERLRTGWLVHSDDGLLDAPLELSEPATLALLGAIGAASGIDASTASATERAALTAVFVAEPDANRITLAVTNAGPDAAYRVIAHFKSSAAAVHGLQLSFGRLAPGETKTRTKVVPVFDAAADPTVTVVAAVTSANAASIAASHRVHLAAEKALAAPTLACAAEDQDPAPGQRVRIRCDVENPNGRDLSGLSYRVILDGITATATGPAALAPHARARFELSSMVPARAKLGAPLQIVVALDAPRLPPVQQQLTVQVAEFHGMCKQGKVSREAYRTKLRRLQAALAAGALTQEELDRYDSELVSCLE